MTPMQLLRQVELPLALPSIVAGIRVATVIAVGTATIARRRGRWRPRRVHLSRPVDGRSHVILAGAIPPAAPRSRLMADDLARARGQSQSERASGAAQSTGNRSRVAARAGVLVGAALIRGRELGCRSELARRIHGTDRPGRNRGAGGRSRGARSSVASISVNVYLRRAIRNGRHRRLRRVHGTAHDGHLSRAHEYRSSAGAGQGPREVRDAGLTAARSAWI